MSDDGGLPSVTGRSGLAVALAALLALAFFAGTLLAPLLMGAGHAAGSLLTWLYGPLCHQMPERSFALASGHQAVCTRCAGLYLGGVAGLIVAVGWVGRRRIRLSPVWLAVAVAPTLIDAVLPWLGLPGLPNGPRHLLAWPAGFAAGSFLAVGIADLVSGRTQSKLAPPEQSLEVLDG